MNEFFPLNKDCALEVYNYFPFILYFHEKRTPGARMWAKSAASTPEIVK